MVKVYKSRIIPVLKHIKGRDVLDIGCCGMGENDQVGGVDFIHGKLVNAGHKVIGLDINKEGVINLNKKGFNVVCHDAQKPYYLEKKFDTIVSEENIEHISNLKTYLENVKSHLKEDGIFVLSTPNAFCFDFILQHIIFGRQRANLYHTHYHNINTIKYLLESNGFEVTHHEFCHGITKAMNFNSKIVKLIVPFLPNRFGRTLIVVAKLYK